MKRRDFLKFGSAGLAGVTFGGFARMPIFRIGNAIACSPGAWKFGVMGDTQWTTPNYDDPDGTNPNSVAASIIDQINPHFIDHGVKFVIQVGDLNDEGIDGGIITRAAHAQDLYNAGIGFFPLRGNHETYSPTDNSYSIPAIQTYFPQTQGLTVFNNGPSVPQSPWDAYNFSSSKPMDPVTGKPTNELRGISYSFDYGRPGGNVRFLILDCWPTPHTNPFPATNSSTGDGYPYGYTVAQQQHWIDRRLDRMTRCTEHAFVLSHQPIMAESHQDTIFSGYTYDNLPWQNAFYASLQKNGVGYYISGHDHMHQRSIIQSPDGRSSLEELICASCSSKFYTPASLTSTGWGGGAGTNTVNQKYRETSISEELYTVGFYVFTVDGPVVIVEYFSDIVGNWQSSGYYPSGNQSTSTAGSFITPTFNFTKKETWGYSLSPWGVSRFTLDQGSGYTLKFGRTTAQIQKQGGTAADYDSRLLSKDAQAWWADRDSVGNAYLASDVLTLLGAASAAITPPSADDPVAIIMSYDSRGRGDDAFVLGTMDGEGNWVNAVDLNFGGTDTFVSGPWTPGSPLGSYGFDPKTRTAWAVVNHDSDFAVIKTRG